MALERHFLGWDEPALPAAVRWLGRHGPDAFDRLSGHLVVLPTAEGGRRFQELLVEAAGEALCPPRVVTPGELAEWLYRPARAVASPLRARLVRAHVLREAPADLVHQLVPHPPQTWDGWWELAGEFETLTRELAAGGLTLGDVAERCTQGAIDVPGPQRWQALASLDARYHEALAEAGLVDRHRARLNALEAGACGCDRPVLLIAAPDLPPVVASMLHQMGGDVTALIHAPPKHAEGFDALGNLVTHYWLDRQIELDAAAIRFVDRPTDQAREAIGVLSAWAGGKYALDEVTIGLGDEALAGPIRRSLALAELPARYAAGQPVARTRPVTLLAALGRFASGRRFDDFAALLRHPDIELYLQHAVARPRPDADDTPPRSSSDHWLTLLDRYAAEHLQGRLDGYWLGKDDRPRMLEAIWRAVTDLLPEGTEPQPLPAWSGPLAAALEQLYRDTELSRHRAADRPVVRALAAIGEALQEQAELDPADAAVPRLTVSEAITLTLSRLRDQSVPEPGVAGAIELMGFLELPVDDAPVTVICSMNEGAVPAARNADAFLPNGLRSALGLADNRRRFARDRLLLQGIVNARAHVTLIAARRSMEGEPLAPSRLLLACDDRELVRRITAFYEPDAEAEQGAADASARPLPPLLAPGVADRFLIPPPSLDEPVPSKLPVTAFRDYLACPYRFYLKHVRGLGPVEDARPEMDALAFGNLAHAVLEAFGKSERANAECEQQIIEFLDEALDELAYQTFGRTRRPALRIQLEQLRERLHAFASEQARLTREGWRIQSTDIERKRTVELHVDGEPFTITGVVDRVDHHPDLGWRIIDYKTGDTAASPRRAHQRRDSNGPQWVDLQLPLYLNLCGLEGELNRTALCYFNLPKKLNEVKLAPADWTGDELDEAFAVRDTVIRAVRGRVFWPPRDPPHYGDAYTDLCADLAMDRERIIERSKAVSSDGG